MTSILPIKKHDGTTVVHDTAKLTRLVEKAKTALILAHPFFGTVALGMPTVITDQVKTAATNSKQIRFNPDFLSGLTDEERVFLVAHECAHPMLEHPFRKKDRNHRKWNQAADYEINYLLTEEKIGKMPDGGLYSKELYDAGKNAEGIYELLPDPEDNDDGQGGEGGYCDGEGPLDDCEDEEGTPAEIQEQIAEWKMRVAQAAQAAKMMGKLSAGLERLVGEILQPKVDWESVMQQFLQKAVADERSFARPNRRFAAYGMYLPSASGEMMGEVLFAVDCSGSINDETIAQFAAEARKVHEDLKPSKLHIVYFDSEVSHYDVYSPDDSLDIKAHGGGGTAFSPVFRYMVQHDIEPVAVVFLTDLCCHDFGTAPDCPVLWVSTEPGTAPFGEVVIM